jgi:dihydropyrimidine dehydrogenase (NAD+) subunit PreT
VRALALALDSKDAHMSLPSTPPAVAAGRLSPAEYARNFADAHPPLTPVQALLEAERCYYCFDAPCTTACPTGIDIPSFIARIAQHNLRGAARTILQENVLGGMCARVCPTEVLCEQACVRNTQEDKPVEIGLLQRHATDAYFAKPGAPLFTRAAPTGRKVAVVGAGPAGLSCAHRLAMLGHAVTLFDDKPKLGGLNEYGLATYKTVDGFAQKEIDWLLSIGGIEVRAPHRLGRDMFLDSLVKDFDAVFLGLGLAGVNALGIAEPAGNAARAAVDFIAELRQASSPAEVAVGRRVLVIGGGMTAVDAAVQSRLLGAEDVTMVYRRGPEAMSASGHEQDWAQTHGVRIKHWGAPQRTLVTDGRLTGVRFARTAMQDGRLVQTSEVFDIEADVVLSAIGQTFEAQPLGLALTLQDGRIATDATGQTSRAKVWAGGDCRHGGRDLTVEAVEHGKLAAVAIDRTLRA